MPESARDECTIDEALEKNVGEFGRGQLRIYCMVNLVWLVTALQVYSMLFVEWNPLVRGQWQCKEGHSKLCTKLEADGKASESQLELLCMKVDQWEWINRCDILGRQKTLVVSATISGFSTALGAFSPNFWVYFAARALTGFGSGGQVVASFVLWTEFVGPSKRGKLGIAAQLLFAAGECLLVGFAWILPTWRRLSLAIGLMSFLFILMCTWIPESPRWLLVKGRKGEATSVLAALACANRTKLPEFPLVDVAAQGNTDRMLLEVIQLKRLRKSLLIVLGTWFSVCGVFHAPVLMLEMAPGDNDLSFLLMAIIEIPLYFVLIFLIDTVGRKPLYAWGLMAGGACCFLMWILPQGLLLPLAIVGKLAIAGAFAVAFPYTTETFFTSVRASTLGAASMFGRIGSSFAPMIATSSGTLGGAVTLLVLGVWGFIAGFLALGLPETTGMPLSDTIEDTIPPASSKRRFLGLNRRKNSQTYLKITDGEGSQS